ncbi:hypothetical protein A9Q82_01535 [Cycloclasticus sp. 46_120_T64]|nr:hypothetical protein A9Q82_01535 [Cycloclasticus sp. 46_120_T64]
MTPEIKKCTENMLIQSVVLKNLIINFHDDIDGDAFNDEFLEHSQDLRYLKMTKQVELQENEKWLYRLYAVIGIRFLSQESPEESDEAVEPMLEIKSEFVAQYESSCELTDEELNLFGQKHVYYHVWPYWREVLQSSCARIGISPIIIPPFRV